MGNVVWYAAAALCGVVLVELVAWMAILRTHRLDLIDVFWGLAFVGAVASMFVFSQKQSFVTVIADILVFMWAARLSVHIWQRFRRSSQQDHRYNEIESHWTKKAWAGQVLFKIVLPQTLLAAIICLPLIVLHTFAPKLTWSVYAGTLLWIVGFVLETVADHQLSAFVRTNTDKNRVLDSGVWQYSRHPNYLGEVMMWWGIGCMTIGTSLWWLGLLGSATISYLIVFVSGVPLAEKHMAGKSTWAEYAAHTAKLVPFVGRKGI